MVGNILLLLVSAESIIGHRSLSLRPLEIGAYNGRREMEGEADIYQKTDVEHILNGLGETLQVFSTEGLTDQLLSPIQLGGAGVVPVPVDVEGGGLPVPRPASPGWLLLLCLRRQAGDGYVDKVWTSPELAGEAGAELNKVC